MYARAKKHREVGPLCTRYAPFKHFLVRQHSVRRSLNSLDLRATEGAGRVAAIKAFNSHPGRASIGVGPELSAHDVARVAEEDTASVLWRRLFPRLASALESGFVDSHVDGPANSAIGQNAAARGSK